MAGIVTQIKIPKDSQITDVAADSVIKTLLDQMSTDLLAEKIPYMRALTGQHNISGRHIRDGIRAQMVSEALSYDNHLFQLMVTEDPLSLVMTFRFVDTELGAARKTKVLERYVRLIQKFCVTNLMGVKNSVSILNPTPYQKGAGTLMEDLAHGKLLPEMKIFEVSWVIHTFSKRATYCEKIIPANNRVDKTYASFPDTADCLNMRDFRNFNGITDRKYGYLMDKFRIKMDPIKSNPEESIKLVNTLLQEYLQSSKDQPVHPLYYLPKLPTILKTITRLVANEPIKLSIPSF